MKNVLLTGGTGLVGTQVQNELVKAGYKIYLLSNRRIKNTPSVKFIPCDMAKTKESFFNKLPQVDAVVHIGAVVDVPEGKDELNLYRKVNMEFSENLFRWSASMKKDIPVIYTSSLSYLQKPLQKVITEEHLIAPLSPYSISKIWGELALFKYAEKSFYRPISFRLSSPVAFDLNLLHQTVVKKWITDAKEGRPITVFGKGTRSQDFVWTGDIAQAVIKAIKNKKAKGIYNICSGSNLTMTELAKLISGHFKTTFKHLKVGTEDSDLWNISIKKARRDFGYKPKYDSKQVIEKLIDFVL